MTNQQLKDYEKVQPICALDVYIDDGHYGTYGEISIEDAISDIDYLLDNALAELTQSYPQGEYKKELQRRVRSAKWFLKKYQK